MKIFSKALMQTMGGYIEYTTPGSYNFYLPRRTRVKLYMVGGGGPRIYLSLYATGWFAGGSGAAFVGGVVLPEGLYNVIVGRDYLSNDTFNEIDTALIHSTLGTLITAGSAGSDMPTTITTPNPFYGGKLTKSSNLEIIYGTVILESNGVAADSNNNPGPSLYNGWGKGSSKNADDQTDGYFKLEYI